MCIYYLKFSILDCVETGTFLLQQKKRKRLKCVAHLSLVHLYHGSQCAFLFFMSEQNIKFLQKVIKIIICLELCAVHCELDLYGVYVISVSLDQHDKPTTVGTEILSTILKFVAASFLWALRFPPLLHRFNGSADKTKLK